MKLTIGENIRNYRKKNDLTQEALADRLGVTYQSISRWENGATYPDLELIPAIAETLKVTVDELLGMSQREKKKRAEEAFDELRRECMKGEYDADKIVELLRDIRRNYLALAWRPWCGNDRAFRDARILPEVRLFSEAYLDRFPMDPDVIQTMAYIEDEEHLQDFLDRHTTSFDCSERALLFARYLKRGDAEKFEPERRFQLCQAFVALLYSRNLLKMGADGEEQDAVDVFRDKALSLIRYDAADDGPDIWVEDRLEIGFKSVARLARMGDVENAMVRLEAVVKLLEDTMSITDEVLLPTSCRFLDGMEWRAKEDWHNAYNDPDGPEERILYLFTEMQGMTSCYCVYPSRYLRVLGGDGFDSLRNRPEFQTLRDRVEALIVTKPKQP